MSLSPSCHSRVGGNPEQLITENLDIWTSAIKNKASTGRGSNKKQELYGIKKLRELILELAVRGLLVPQDPNDEPASVLLEKITAEKAQLLKEGKIKKQKILPPISEEEKPFQLPQEWTWTRLEAISDINGGFAFKSSKYVEEGTRVIRISDFDEKGFKHDKIVRYEYTPDLSPYLLAEKNILMAMTGGTVGKSLLVSGLDEDMVVNQRVATIRLLSNILPNFIHITLQTAIVQNVIREAKNSTNDNISMSDIKGFFIALPPENHINRIVAKVDELMALCDQLEQQAEASLNAHQALVETLLKALLDAAQSRDDSSAFEQAWKLIAEHFDVLFTTEQSIDQLKQTILQLAVMGKLVPQDPNDEPASVLLEKIAAEKERLVKEKKYLKTGKLLDKEEIWWPDRWVDVQIGEICPSVVPNRDKPKSYTGSIPWVTLPDFPNESFYLNHESVELKMSETEIKDYRARLIPAGSVLMSCVGRFGLTAINKVEVSCNQQVHGFVVLGGVSAEYLSLVIKAAASKLERVATSTTVAYLNKSKCESIQFGLPPVQEQKRIVSKLEEIFLVCDELKTRLKKSQMTQLHLADAMAEQAIS